MCGENTEKIKPKFIKREKKSYSISKRFVRALAISCAHNRDEEIKPVPVLKHLCISINTKEKSGQKQHWQ